MIFFCPFVITIVILHFVINHVCYIFVTTKTNTPMTATKATRFKEARLLACNHNLTIGQALTLLTGGNVSGNRLSDYEEQESGTDAPYATVGMMHYSL